jgi:hypothetical protein
MPPSRTVAPYSPPQTPPAPETVARHGRHLPPFIPVTNLLERTFVEVRRHTNVIGRFPDDASALSLIWAVLELSSRGWRGVVTTPKTVAEIERLRRQQRPTNSSHESANPEEVVAA